MNKKGFAISIILYSVVFLLITIFYMLLGVLRTRYTVSHELRDSIIEQLNVYDGADVLDRKIERKIADSSCNPIWIDDRGTESTDDDVKYFTGLSTCVDLNYVWYSGKLWRITAIYSDGAMKMVTENNITTIAFNVSDNTDFYTDSSNNSYMYQWLNEDFYNTLYNASNIIDNSKQWNVTGGLFYRDMPETTMITANVGLLTASDYYNTYRCINNTACNSTAITYANRSYLNNSYSFYLLNAKYPGSYIYHIYSGVINDISPDGSNGVRPAIVLKPGVKFLGNGTKDSPFRIVGDKETGKANDLVNTRLSGEYIKLKNGNNEQVFRIIGVENSKTKIIAMNYAENKNKRPFATSNSDIEWGSGTTTDNGTWYTILNTSNGGYLANLKNKYGQLFDSGTYYLGLPINNDYKSVKDESNTFDIGLPYYGEMFAAQQSNGSVNSISMWLMNKAERGGSSALWYLLSSGNASAINEASTEYGVRPTLYLKSTVKIRSGSGTQDDPYIVGL